MTAFFFMSTGRNFLFNRAFVVLQLMESLKLLCPFLVAGQGMESNPDVLALGPWPLFHNTIAFCYHC